MKTEFWFVAFRSMMAPQQSRGLSLLLLAFISVRIDASIHENGACPIVGLLPFSAPLSSPADSGVDQANEAKYQSNVGFSLMAAAQLAMDHFNERDASVVPELADLRKSCTVHFPEPLYRDSGMDPAVAVRAILGVASFAASAQTPHEMAERLPCAVLGPTLDESAKSVDVLTNSLRVPQLIYNSESDLMLSEFYPNTLGTVLSSAGRARGMVDFLKQRGFNRKYLAVILDDSPHAQDFTKILQEVGAEKELEVTAFQYTSQETESGFSSSTEAIRKVLRNIKSTGIKGIFLNLDTTASLREIASVMEDEGFFAPDYLYIISPLAVPLNRVANFFQTEGPNSPLYKLLAGSIIFDRMDGFRLNESDPFLAAWRQQNFTFVERLNAMQPLSWNDPGYFQASANYFQTVDPVNYASFIYDAVMTIGFGACGQQGAMESNDPPDEQDSNIWLQSDTEAPADGKEFDISEQGGAFSSFRERNSADQLVDFMLASKFQGASGRIRFGWPLKVRNPDDVAIGVYNLRPLPTANGADSGTRLLVEGLDATLSAILSYANAAGWEILGQVPIVFRDGSTTPPVVTREILNENFLSTWVRAIGLVLLAISWVFALGCMFFVWKLTNDPVVKRSQPFFLQMLCVGSVILSASIFTLSWDEGAGWSDHQLDIACVATPWLFIIGHLIIFSALFTKLRRLDRVLQFRRSVVTIRNVMGPVVQLVLLALVVLALWTALDPWTWERDLISESPSETYGECQCDHFWAFFGPLMALIVFAEGLTLFFAWKTSDVPEDYRETLTVVAAICTQLQAWLMGVPILVVLGSSSPDATYFGRVFLIWIFAVSSMGIVVAPKILHAWRLRKNPDQTPKTRGSVSDSKGNVRVSGFYHPMQAGQLKSTIASDPSSTYSADSHWGLVDVKKSATMTTMETDNSSTVPEGSSILPIINQRSLDMSNIQPIDQGSLDMSNIFESPEEDEEEEKELWNIVESPEEEGEEESGVLRGNQPIKGTATSTATKLNPSLDHSMTVSNSMEVTDDTCSSLSLSGIQFNSDMSNSSVTENVVNSSSALAARDTNWAPNMADAVAFFENGALPSNMGEV